MMHSTWASGTAKSLSCPADLPTLGHIASLQVPMRCPVPSGHLDFFGSDSDLFYLDAVH